MARKGTTLSDVVREEMKSPTFAREYAERRRVQEIARAVRSMRESSGLSQADLARLIGTKQPAIARLETSQHNTPQWQTLDRIAMALSKQVTLSLGDIEEGKPVVRITSRKTRATRATREHRTK
jgi:transcriptional regulator with XRE-family HTH domain